MAIDIENPTDQSATSLIGGIVGDLEDLLKQQVQITRLEITQEVHKATESLVYFATGGAVLFFGALLTGFAAVYLLHWATSPAGSDPASLPLWACYILVGGPLLLLGAALTWGGINRLKSINPLRNPATEALKENVKWATNSK